MLLATSIAVYSYSEKGRRKSARDNPDRDCGWFWVRRSSQKFERMAREAMDVCLRVLREATKEFLTVTVPGTVYWSYLILPLGIVACTFLPTTSLEIAVYELKEKHEARVFCLGLLATSCKKIDHLVCGGTLSFQNAPNAFQIFYFNRRNFGWGVGVKREKKGLVFGVVHPDSEGWYTEQTLQTLLLVKIGKLVTRMALL